MSGLVYFVSCHVFYKSVYFMLRKLVNSGSLRSFLLCFIVKYCYVGLLIRLCIYLIS